MRGKASPQAAQKHGVAVNRVAVNRGHFLLTYVFRRGLLHSDLSLYACFEYNRFFMPSRRYRIKSEPGSSSL